MSELKQAVVQPLLDWFDEHHRTLPWRSDPAPYRVWVSEIMLQQTRVEAVLSYFDRWMAALPTVQALAAAEEETVLKLWEGLGYYSRARNLHKAAKVICAEYGGVVPQAYEQLLELPGIGEYTAGAVSSIAFGQAVPAIDGNVLRVAARLSCDEAPITDPKVKKQLREQMLPVLPGKRTGDFNQALMDLGATVCLPNGAPRCGDCPVQHLCEGYHRGMQQALPYRAAKKARRIEQRTVLLVRYGQKVGLHKRSAKGLLAGLWELPSLDGALPADAVRTQLAEQGWQVSRLLSLQDAKHIFTHVEWWMKGFWVEVTAPPDGLVFVSPTELREEYALPSAFRAFLTVIEGEK